MKYLIQTLLLIFTISSTAFGQGLDHVQGEILIRIDQKLFTPSHLDILNNQFNTHSIRMGKCLSKHMNIYKLLFDNTEVNENDLYLEIKKDNKIEEAQLNHHIYNRETTPDDPLFGNQWQWMNPLDHDVDADLAWDITTGGVTANGDSIVVTVVDDGINFTHEDFGNNLWYNLAEIDGDGIDNDGNGYIDDYRGWNTAAANDNVGNGSHGVNVAGMIGAQGNNTLGVTGINWDVKIMTVVYGSLDEASVIEAYSYPLQARILYNETNGEEGAFVVATNSSWGIDGGNPDDAPLWCAFYDTLGVNGIISCGATANNSVDIDVVGDLPTACSSDYLVSVTATNNNDDLTFAAWGLTTVDVGAPGDNIYTTNNGGYGNTSGTSFATPLTAGIIGLLYSAPCSNIATLALDDPAQASSNVIQYLYEGVDLVPSLEGKTTTGGRVNANNSLLLLMADCGPCPGPSNIHTDNVLFTSTDILWHNSDSTLTNDLRYRPLGSDTWTEITDATSPFSISSLDTCMAYEVQVKANCASENSDYSSTFTFTTEGCCAAPSNFSVNNISEDSADLSWGEVLIASSYNVHFINVTTMDTMVINTTNLSMNLTLSPCQDYSVFVETVCPDGDNFISNIIDFSSPGCGACLDMPYCELVSGSIQDEWISSVIIGSNVNESITNDTYSNYTDLNWTMPKNVSLDVILVPGYAGNTFSEYFKIWIDLDQNGTFNGNNETLVSPGFTVNDTLFTTLTIPQTALSGNTRMRIAMKFFGSDTNLNPCGNFQYGEVEDYCITIGEDPGTCNVIENVELNSPTQNSIDITWDNIDNSISYLVEYKKAIDINWLSETTSNNYYSLNGLEQNTSYEIRVTTICPFTQSDLSPIYSLSTVGLSSIPASSFNVFPSLFDNTINIENKSSYTLNNISLYSINGNKIQLQNINLKDNLIHIENLAHLNTGSYILIIEGKFGINTYKIIKE